MGRKSREKRERRQREERLQRHYRDPQPVKYPVQPRPSPGLTGSERALAKLARSTFLSIWSYPNVFRDERRADGTALGHEVADLLVVFEQHVIIISDKDCAYPTTGKPDVNWSRWYRKAVAKSAAQVFGAERWIKQHPTRLFLDAKLTVPFPLKLPNAERMRVHRVVVAHGVIEQCRKALGGNGTLQIAPSIVGDEHMRPAAEGGAHFAIGQVDPSKGFVHVFDDAALAIVMRERDTVADFVRYLERREALILGGRLALAAGEEALMGWYLLSMNEDHTEHDFTFPADISSPVTVDESWWHKYYGTPRYHRKMAADRISYVWDDTIELFTRHFLNGTSDHLTDTEPHAHEITLRFFARETRLRRRVLAKNLVDMHATTPAHMRRLRLIPPMSLGDPIWILLLVPFGHEIDYRLYRDTRREYLSACLKVAKLQCPEAVDFVGFATESGRGSAGSEDAIYMDARVWTEEMNIEARYWRKHLNILTTPRLLPFSDHEFPDSPNQKR